ncbi:MAG: hypothetical protein AAB875_04825 [Patescibacteria group bacterium]
MLKKFIFSLIVIGVFLFPQTSFAQENCVQVYGGGVVCGAEAPEHKPVPAGLADNPLTIGLGLLLASGALLYASRKIRAFSQITE